MFTFPLAFYGGHAGAGAPETVPVNTIAPAISGTQAEFETLSCSTGTWSGSATISYSYQWERSGSPIGGATSNTYTLVSADVGETLTCVVTATNTAGSDDAESAATGIIVAASTYQSLEFDGSSDYLSMSHANWGSSSHSKFSIIRSVYIDSLSTDRPLFQKGSYASSGYREYQVIVKSDGAVQFFSAGSGGSSWILRTSAGVISTAGWYAIKVDIDTSQASGSRGTISVNGSTLTLATNIDQTDINSTSDSVYIGHDPNAGNYLDGLQHQCAFVSGANPSNGDVFNGTSGGLKDLSGLTGLFSYIGAASNATTDSVLATAWTNNNSVTVSASVPS